MDTMLYAGFSKIDITPSEPCHMAGYSREGLSTSVLDPIQVNSVAVNVNGNSFILTILDSIILDPEFCSLVKAGVAERTGVDPAHVSVACIHTHSAPAYFKLSFEDTWVEPALTAGALAAMVDSAAEAHAALAPATVRYETATIDGLYGNRNVKGGVEDKEVRLLSFFGEDGAPMGALFHLSAHPTILNGSSTALSADLVGHVRARLEDALGRPVAVANGTCGDVSTRFYRTASGIEELEGTAQALFDQFMAKRAERELRAGEVRCGRVEMESAFDAATDSDWQRMTAEVQAQAAENSSPMTDFFLARQQLKLEMSPVRLTLISQWYAFGNLLVVTMPGDVCSELGRRIRDAFPQLEVIVMGYSNTYCNYLVPDEDYGRYFETYNSRLPRGAADRFTARVIATIEAAFE